MAITYANNIMQFEANGDTALGLFRVKSIIINNFSGSGTIQRFDSDGIVIFRRSVTAGDPPFALTFPGDGVWLKDLLYQENPSVSPAFATVELA